MNKEYLELLDLKRQLKELINKSDVAYDISDGIYPLLNKDKELYNDMIGYLREKTRTQDEIFIKAFDISGFDYKSPVYIEDDDGTLYTQEEWKERNKNNGY